MPQESRRLHRSNRINTINHISITRKDVTKPVSLHFHDYYELELVVRGQGQQNLNGSVYPLTPGTMYFLTPIDFHAVTPGEDLEIINVSFDESQLSVDLQTILLNRRRDLIFSSQETLEELTALIRRLEWECDRRDSFSLLAQGHLLELLLLPMVRSIRKEEDLPKLLSEGLQDSLQYVFRHFREEITLEQIACAGGYSPNYFSHLFHKAYGIRLTDFLARLRLNYARMMLLTTGQSVAHIARVSGFSSASNFFRVFRKETGQSPLEYRSHEKNH